MNHEEWNESDALRIEMFTLVNPFDRGPSSLYALLDVIEKEEGLLRPEKVWLGLRCYRYSRERVWQALEKQGAVRYRHVHIDGMAQPEVTIHLTFWRGERIGFHVGISVKPLRFFQETAHQQERASMTIRAVRALARHIPFSHGFAHPRTDAFLSNDPRFRDHHAPDGVYEALWLNFHGRELVEAVGRERVLSVPSHHLEELLCGGVLYLTRPTPADFDSEEARLAQARALVHLRPELEPASVITTLRERSLTFQPLEHRFHPDIAPLLEAHAAYLGLQERRKQIERYNAWVPPEVSEWLPLQEAPASDMEDPAAEAEHYENLHAERLIALLHKDVPGMAQESPKLLPQVDYHVYHCNWSSYSERDKERLLIPLLGAYLGMRMVRHLGGRWVPRRKLEEAQVVLGERAWLPFLRARHLLRHKEAWLESSLTQLYLAAARTVGARGLD